MIRIVHVLGELGRGGAETMVMNLYKAIDRTKIQFDFIVHSDQKGKGYYDEIIALGGRVFVFPKFKLYNVFQVIRNWKHFFKNHTEYKILHSHIRSYASIFIPIANKYGVTTIIHSHSTSNGSGLIAILKKYLQFFLRFQADYFFACSKEAGKWLFGKNIISSNRFYMLQNAIDLQKYKFNENIRKEYRDKLKLNETNVYLHIGRFHQSKNHLFLLDVFDLILKEYNNSRLLLVGDGELRNEIVNKIKLLGLDNSVILLGVRSDVSEILQASDCFLFPSKWEGLPVSVVEAQASGLHCFVSNKITQDVNLTESIHYLEIDCGAQEWVNQIKRYQFNRFDTSHKIKNAGFDINTTSKWLLMFYEKILL